MSDTRMICPYCGETLPEDTTVCPACQEDLAALARLEYGPAIHYNDGLALAQEGKLDLAHKKLITAIELQGDFSPAHVLLAKVYAQQGLWTEAEVSVSRALELLPEDRQVRKLATDIAKASLESTKTARERKQTALQVRRSKAEGYFAAYRRDVTSAFGLGIGVATLLGMILSWIGTRRRRREG